jgi:16S rRNA (guanine527-N7)-methyltransferase
MSDNTVELAVRAASWAGITLASEQQELLSTYAEWLVAEAIPAGGLGPREADRIWSRHVGDAITFASAWEAPPPEILDVGSGVGLPGIPLAVCWPDTMVTVLDRGGRRVRLLHRIARILAIPNIVVAQGDVFSVADEWHGMAFRGAVKPAEGVGLAARLLEPGCTAAFGLSRRQERPDTADDLINLAGAFGMEADVYPVPTEILDAPSWLLRMSFDV